MKVIRNKKILSWMKITYLVGLGFLPTVSFAAPPKDLAEFFKILSDLILGSIIPLLVAVALVVFIWGVLKYITSAGDQTKRTEGIQFIIWGLVGLFVIVSIWGIIDIVAGTFGIPTIVPGLPE